MEIRNDDHEHTERAILTKPRCWRADTQPFTMLYRYHTNTPTIISSLGNCCRTNTASYKEVVSVADMQM